MQQNFPDTCNFGRIWQIVYILAGSLQKSMKDAQIEHEWRSLPWTIMFFSRCYNNFYLICVYTEMGIPKLGQKILGKTLFES